MCVPQWPCGLRRRSAAASLLRSRVRIPPEAWMFVCCECRVLSVSGLCDELVTRPEESYRLWWVVVCDLETSRMRRPWPALGLSATAKKSNVEFPLGHEYSGTRRSSSSQYVPFSDLKQHQVRPRTFRTLAYKSLIVSQLPANRLYFRQFI